MDSPASVPLLSVAIVLGAIVLVSAVSLVLELRYNRRIRRLPFVAMPVTAMPVTPMPVASMPVAPAARSAEPATDRGPETGPAAAVAPDRDAAPSPAPSAPDTALSPEPTTGAVSADAVRRIVDPSLPSVRQSFPWRPAGHAPLPTELLGYDASRVWTKAESDGLVALFHLGTELSSLATEMGVDERVLVEELARRVFGAIDPVVDPTMPRVGSAWTDADRAAIEPVGCAGACLSDTARRLGRDQLDVVLQLIRAGRRPAHAETVR